MIRNHDNQIKRSTRATRVQHTPSSIETPACGYDWTESGVRELASEITQKTGRAIKFLFNKNTGQGDHQSIESNIFIAPTALLQEYSDYPIYGAFAKTSFTQKLTYPYCLGQYQGALKKIIEEQEAEESCLYTFNLGNGFELSAEHEGSWTRMINSASSEETANIYYERVNDKIYCYLKHPIRAGEQFLGYYGDAYQHDNKRFLQSCDNWETSFKRYQTHSALYQDVVSDGVCYALPDIQQLTRETINLPILKRSNHDFFEASFLPQWQQENKTLLHWACETSDLELLKSLRELNPDISIQLRISGQTALHAVMLNQALSSAQKIEFLDVILSNQQSVRQLIAIVLQDKDEQSILHLAIEQEDIELIAYILTTELQKRNYKDGKDIRNCLNKQGRDFILMALATGSLPVLEVIRSYMGAEDVGDILENNEEVLREIWNDLALRYDDAVLSQIKLFLRSFIDLNDQEIFQKLDASLPVDESTSKMEECSRHEEEVDLFSAFVFETALLCTSALSHDQIKTTITSLAAERAVLCTSDLSITKIKRVAHTLVSGGIFICHPGLSDIQIQSAVGALGVGTVLLCTPDLSEHQIKVAVAALRSKRILHINSSLPDHKIRVALGALKIGGILRCGLGLSEHKIQLAAGSLRVGRMLYINSSFSDHKIQVAAGALKAGGILCCDSGLSEHEIQLAVGSLRVGRILYINSSLSDHKIQVASGALKAGRILRCDSGLSEHKIQLAAGSLRVGGVLHIDAGFSDNKNRIATGSLGVGRVFLCHSSLLDNQIQLAAGSLGPGAGILCSSDLSDAQIEVAAGALSVGAFFVCPSNLSEKQIRMAAGSLSSGCTFLLNTGFSDDQIKISAGLLKTERILKLDPALSDDQIKVAVSALGFGRAWLCTSDLSDSQIQVVSPSCKVRVILPRASEVSDNQIRAAASSLAAGSIFQCIAELSEHQIQVAAGALNFGVVMLCSSDLSDSKVRVAVDAVVTGRGFLDTFGMSEHQIYVVAGQVSNPRVHVGSFKQGSKNNKHITESEAEEDADDFSEYQLELTSHLPYSTVYVCTSDLPKEPMCRAVRSLAPEASIFCKADLSVTKIKAAVEALPQDGIFLCHAGLSARQIYVAARALRDGRRFRFDSGLSDVQIQVAIDVWRLASVKTYDSDTVVMSEHSVSMVAEQPRCLSADVEFNPRDSQKRKYNADDAVQSRIHTQGLTIFNSKSEPIVQGMIHKKSKSTVAEERPPGL